MIWGLPLCLGNKAVPRVTQPKQASFVVLLGGSEGKASACNAGDLGSIPGSGRCRRLRFNPWVGKIPWRFSWRFPGERI